MTFTAIDFETANKHYICSIGIVCVENNIIVDEYHTLVKPPNNTYNWYATQVHGITAEDTINAPSFIDIYPEIKKRLFNKTVVAHNEAFDRNVLIKSMIDNGLDYKDLKVADK